MQTTTTYLGKRSYLDLILLLAVAVTAVGFGHWVIPNGGSGSSVAASEISTVPSWIQGNFADLKGDQLAAQDRAAGLDAVTSAAAAPASSSQADRFANLKIAQLNSNDETPGLYGSAADRVPSVVVESGETQAERVAALRQAQLDSQDMADGLTVAP
jgi:hypothetical protein